MVADIHDLDLKQLSVRKKHSLHASDAEYRRLAYISAEQPTNFRFSQLPIVDNIVNAHLQEFALSS